MKKYAKIINEITKEVQIGVGCSDEYYIEIGMTLMDVEQAYNFNWYVEGFAPIKPEPLPPTQEELDAQNANRVRSIRGEYMAETLNKVERYETQKAAEIETTDSAETYRNYLLYLQYLRDVPQSEDFPNIEVLTFDEWVN